MYNVQYPININTYYNDGTIPSSSELTDPAQAITSNTPFWQNITISNLTSTWDSSRASYYSGALSNSYTGVIWGLPEAPVLNLAMNNVKISGAKYGIDVDHVRNLSFDTQCSFTNTSGANIIATANNTTPPVDAIMVKSGWGDVDIGAPTPATTTIYNPNTDTQSLLVGGSGFTGTSDQFNIESQDVTGNALVTAKVATIATTNANAKAGVMMRDGTAVSSLFAAVVEQTNKQVMFLYRNSVGGPVTSSAVVGDTTNAKYVKLTRVGNQFSAFYSTNGTTWTAVGSPVSIAMSPTLKAGLCDSSQNTASATSASFTGANVVVDNTAPNLVSDSYLYSTSLNKLSFSFSENVAASLSTGSLSVVIVNPDGSTGASINVNSMSYDSASNNATFTLATPLSDGNYRATLNAVTTTDAVGNALAGGNVSLPFFVLPADVNRDRAVNALDFNALAAHFGSAGGFTSCDFDFNGVVNSADFNLLAQHFNELIPSPTIPVQPLLFSAKPIELAAATLADDRFNVLALAGIACNSPLFDVL
jgi:hypothetical protein